MQEVACRHMREVLKEGPAGVLAFLRGCTQELQLEFSW